MYLLLSLYIVALFVALTPGVLLRLPAGGSKLTVAVVHGLVFAVIYCLTQGLVSDALYGEGFKIRRTFSTVPAVGRPPVTVIRPLAASAAAAPPPLSAADRDFLAGRQAIATGMFNRPAGGVSFVR
jgi:hypothetical protein